MRSRKVTRWYCDFCKAARFQQPAMLRHETNCTANPNRVCSICTGDPQTGAADLPELIAFCIAKATTDDKTLREEHVDELRKLCDGCPACMTAAVRQSHVYALWDCRKEFSTFWTEWKRMQAEEMASIVGYCG